MEEISLKKYSEKLSDTTLVQYKGRVSKVVGLTIESIGPQVKVGEMCKIYPVKSDVPVMSEVVGFTETAVLLMPLGDMQGIGPGATVIASGNSLEVQVGESLLGRVLDGLGNPIDDKEPLNLSRAYPVNNMPPNPLSRMRITDPLPLGVKVLDGMLNCGRGHDS